TDFYSAYHRWSPDRPVNWRFLAARQRLRDDPAGKSAFIREPSLSDPAWLDRVGDRLRATVAAQRVYRPLYYNLADEPGIAETSAFWDFDFSDPSLAALRDWLKQLYPSLAALNAEWSAHFADWDSVIPPTTSDTMKRTDVNFAAWADFRAWMDV